MRKVCVCLALVVLGACDVPPAEETEERKQAIGWYGGTYTWSRCNVTGWPTCGGAGKIAFYRGYNQTGEGIQFWTTGGNQDVWMDLDYYTWSDGANVNDTAKSWMMWQMDPAWTQKAWICQHVGCQTYGNPDNMLAYYVYPGIPPYYNGNGNIWGVSAFWLMNHY